MKRKNIMLLCGALTVLIIGIYSILNGYFPKAEAIRYPAVEEITSIYTSCNTPNASIPFSKEDYTDFLERISNAKPTRKLSISETPSVLGYYMIEIITDEREYRYFIYEEASKIYIEVPYVGIYRSDIELYNCILKYHQEE